MRRVAANLLDTYVGGQAGERILAGKIRRGDITDMEFEKLVAASQMMQSIPLYVDQTGGKCLVTDDVLRQVSDDAAGFLRPADPQRPRRGQQRDQRRQPLFVAGTVGAEGDDHVVGLRSGHSRVRPYVLREPLEVEVSRGAFKEDPMTWLDAELDRERRT